MSQDNPYAAPLAQVADVQAHDAAPALWNPGAAASWSLLFTPVFGAILHMKNWQALGEPAKADTAKNWAIANVLYIVIVFAAAFIVPESKPVDAMSRLGGLVMLLTWYYANGKAQMAFVTGRYGKTYPRRGWGKPIGFAVLAILAFLFVAIVVGVIIGVATGAV